MIDPLFGGSAPTTWRGAHMIVNPGELEGYYRYFLPDGPDPEYDFLVSACREASLFFDVGANQGLYALALATAHPHLKVVAFEPDERLVASIRRNTALNPSLAPRLSVEPVAVSDRSATLQFMPAGNANSGTGRLSDSTASNSVEVRAVALADYITKTGLEPQVLKIDVEGAEVEVLRGLGRFAAATRAILIELHPDAFSGTARQRYQLEIVDALKSAPLAWRFLIGETEWVTSLDPASYWASRIHAFGTRMR